MSWIRRSKMALIAQINELLEEEDKEKTQAAPSALMRSVRRDFGHGLPPLLAMRMDKDPFLAPLYGNPHFAELIARIKMQDATKRQIRRSLQRRVVLNVR